MIKNTKKYHRCSICGMTFKDAKIADECEYRCLKGIGCYPKMVQRAVSF
ncbi:hypothetical protein GOV12_04170 [Candidatus Pacearchaeota archaeon]|nr:hypothetical protein [Candidatus Pacearchaeota archaeon]